MKTFIKGYKFSLPPNKKKCDHKTATKIKDIGNNFYKEGNYPKALEQYKEALTYLTPADTK
jgi:hypothetical protein